MVKESDAVEIISLFRSKGMQLYLDGGWGVDALVGFESRAHNDIDIFIEKQVSEHAIKLLKDNGYSEKVMEYTTPDHTVWQDGNSRIIDLHMFSRNDNGDLIFEGEIFPKEVFPVKVVLTTLMLTVYLQNGRSYFTPATNSMRMTLRTCCYFATNSVLQFRMKFRRISVLTPNALPSVDGVKMMPRRFTSMPLTAA